MGSLGWYLIVALVMASLALCWRFGWLLPRVDDAVPARAPDSREKRIWLTTWVVSLILGVLAGLGLHVGASTTSEGGILLPAHDSPWSGPLWICLACWLLVPAVSLKLLLPGQVLQHYRLRDARRFGGIDTFQMSLVMGILMVAMGIDERPIHLAIGRDGVRVFGHIPWASRNHGWPVIREIQVVEEEKLLPFWWGRRIGVVFVFANGTRRRVFVDNKNPLVTAQLMSQAVDYCRPWVQIRDLPREQ